jgi:hypothetical protein
MHESVDVRGCQAKVDTPLYSESLPLRSGVFLVHQQSFDELVVSFLKPDPGTMRTILLRFLLGLTAFFPLRTLSAFQGVDLKIQQSLLTVAEGTFARCWPAFFFFNGESVRNQHFALAKIPRE